jgi:hypothetical protein
MQEMTFVTIAKCYKHGIAVSLSIQASPINDAPSYASPTRTSKRPQIGGKREEEEDEEMIDHGGRTIEFGSLYGSLILLLLLLLLSWCHCMGMNNRWGRSVFVGGEVAGNDGGFTALSPVPRGRMALISDLYDTLQFQHST